MAKRIDLADVIVLPVQHEFGSPDRGVVVSGSEALLGHPIFVVGKDAASNTITVGARDLLEVRACAVGEANWLCDPGRFADWSSALAKYRSTAAANRKAYFATHTHKQSRAAYNKQQRSTLARLQAAASISYRRL